MPKEPVERRLIVDAPAARLDRFVAERMPELSRTRVAQLVEEGHVLLNGERPRKSESLEPGDRVDVTLPPPVPTAVEAEPIPLDIVYEDADLLVVDKPAGLVVHPAAGHRTGTLVNALLHHVSDLSGIGGELRPGIVHRLDKDTSGLLVVAKHDQAHRRLSRALKKREVKRIYLAACWGHVDEAVTVDAPVGRSPGDRKRMAVVKSGRRAVTHLRRLERWRAADLLRVELETGRTHQIRIHLAHLGHPVVGDELYGRGGHRGISGPDRQWAAMLESRVPRQFLHAAELHFAHPRTGEPRRFQSPLPAQLAAAAAWARETSMPE